MIVKQLPLGALGTNCYLISNEHEALIIDPGDSSETVIGLISELQVKPKAILLTHAHFDHIGAVDDLREEYDVEVYLHRLEHNWLGDPMLNGSKFFGVSRPLSLNDPDQELREGHLAIGSFKFDILHTPGHSPGSVSFFFQDDGFLICGDTLFQGSIGRTDLPGGDHNQLIHNIKSKILVLPPQTIVYPGHGPATTIKEEQQFNPFL